MNEDLERLKAELESLKAARNKLTVEEPQEIEEPSTDISIDININEELEEIDKQIKELEEDIKQTAKAYEQSYKNLKNVIDEYEKTIENTNLLSEEEINELREKYEAAKLEENERSNEIKRRLDNQKKIIRQIKAHRTAMINNVKASEALELTYDEYKEVTSTLRKTSIMNAILEEKGLRSIIDKKANERTKEEKESLKEAKKDIINEISELKREHDDYSVLDTIEALYSLETKYIKVETPKETKLQLRNLMIMAEDSHRLPYRVVNPNAKVNNNIVEEAPKDMENAAVNDKVDLDELKPAEEKVTIFKDDDTYYVRKYAVDRFKLKSADLDSEIKINGSVCYKISETDVERIKENANNAFAPYMADIKEITLENTDNNEITDEDTKDELIPGTSIKKPRDRKTYETDEEYEAFLKAYYEKVFAEEEEKSLMVIPEEEKSLMVVGEQEEVEEKDDNIEKITICKEDDGRYYASQYVIERYKLKSADKEEIRIDGILYHEISEEDVNKLIDNSNNSFSPYKVDIVEVDENEEKITDEELEDIISDNLEDEEQYKKDKFVDDLNATNIVATKDFKLELKLGETLYNIYHSIPKGVKKIYKSIKDGIHQADEFFGGLIEGPVVESEEETSKTR